MLLRTPQAELTRDPGTRIVRLKRTSLPASVSDLMAFAAEMMRVLPLVDRAPLVLLSDIREAPMATDPSYGKQIGPALEEIARGFADQATLVRTAIGRLQASRVAREGGQDQRVFSDEAEALAYLRGVLERVSARPSRP